MKFNLLLISSLLLGMLGFSSAYAETDLENTALMRIVQVLNSTTPLINEAERQQDKTARVQFQYQTLRADLNKIKAGINQKIHTTTIEPRVVSPIRGDYLIQKGKHR